MQYDYFVIVEADGDGGNTLYLPVEEDSYETRYTNGLTFQADSSKEFAVYSREPAEDDPYDQGEIEGYKKLVYSIGPIYAHGTNGFDEITDITAVSYTHLDVYKRQIMLVAILEKKLGYNMQNQDVYLNIAGGLKISEPATDLAAVMAIASNYKNFIVDYKTVILGEVGLTGEVRSITYPEKRVNEAKKMCIRDRY